MKLSNVELIPGVIVDIEDPKKLGRIKATVPGLFSPDMTKETLPWIYRLSMSQTNTFDCPIVGSKIWCINNKDNYCEYWYIPYFEIADHGKEVIQNYDNTQLVFSRQNSSGTTSQLYYNDGEGIVVKNDSSKINLDKNGDLTAVSKSGKELLLKSDKVQIGKTGGSYEEAVLGDKLKTLLSNLQTGISIVASTAARSPHTLPLVSPLNDLSSQLASDITKILSKNVNLN